MKIICSWCKKFMGEKEPFNDFSETQGKCPQCIEKQRLTDEAIKRKAVPANLPANSIIKREVIILAIVLFVGFLNRKSATEQPWSYNSLSRTASFGNSSSSSMSVNFHVSMFWMIVYGYLIYLFIRISFLVVKRLRKK